MAWGTLWGVDSAANANANPGQGTGTLYDQVVSQYGRSPDFWGRYLNLYPMDATEVNYIHSKNTGILVLWSGVSSNISQGYPGGKTDGQNAVSTLQNLQNAVGYLSACTIFADVEQKNAGGVSSDTIAGYFEGFCDAVVTASTVYTPGLYFPTGSLQTTFGCAYYTAATANNNVGTALIYSPEPEPGCSAPPGPAGSPFGAYCNGNEYGVCARVVCHCWRHKFLNSLSLLFRGRREEGLRFRGAKLERNPSGARELRTVNIHARAGISYTYVENAS